MPLLTIDPHGDIKIVVTNPHSAIRQFRFHPEKRDEKTPGSPKKLPRLSKKEKKKISKRRANPAPVIADPHEVIEDPDPGPIVDGTLAPGQSVEGDSVAKAMPLDSGNLEENEDTNAVFDSTPQPETTAPDTLRLFVSSKHLCLASSTFSSMLNGPWREGGNKEIGIRTIEAHNLDPEALVVVLDIIHGKHFATPQKVSLELLANIACVVDYYNCHEAMEPFINTWIKALESELPNTYSRQCILWMFVSWVFLLEEILMRMAKIALMQCEGDIDDLGLPLPFSLIRIVEEKRAEMKDAVLSDLILLWEDLSENERYSQDCCNMLLGALTRQMKKAGIFCPWEKPIYHGNIKNLHEQLRTFTSSHYCCSCRLQVEIDPLVNKNQKLLEEFDLKNICSKRLQQRADSRQIALESRSSCRLSLAEGGTNS